MTILVTGGAGFIGSNLVKRLNDEGIDDIVIMDFIDDNEKLKNIASLKYRLLIPIGWSENQINEQLDAWFKIYNFSRVFHLGAISDASCDDARKLYIWNVFFSNYLFNLNLNIPIHYASSASVYGNKNDGTTDPLNGYAASKLIVENVADKVKTKSHILGFRYHNVFGPNEFHKRGQSSPILKFFNDGYEKDRINIFNVDAKRDFVPVSYVCDVHIWMMKNFKEKNVHKVFDVGLGESHSFDEVAQITKNILNNHFYRQSIDLPWGTPADLPFVPEAVKTEGVPFPDSLKGKYQYKTKADLSHLAEVGCSVPIPNFKASVTEYLNYLLEIKKRNR